MCNTQHNKAVQRIKTESNTLMFFFFHLDKIKRNELLKVEGGTFLHSPQSVSPVAAQRTAPQPLRICLVHIHKIK